MPKLKREIFLRPNRMVHRFGESDDPLSSSEYFDAPYPDGIKSVRQHGQGGFTSKEKGQHSFREELSPVNKFRGGDASLEGPKPDYADAVARRTPSSTVDRTTQAPLAEKAEETKKRK